VLRHQRRGDSDEIIPLIKQLAERASADDRPHTATSNHNEYFGDGVHPTDAAYAIVARSFTTVCYKIWHRAA